MRHLFWLRSITSSSFSRGDGEDGMSLVGREFRLISWRDVSPTGSFIIVDDGRAVWDSSNIYATGAVKWVSRILQPRTLVSTFLGLAVLAAGGGHVHFRGYDALGADCTAR